MASKSLTEFTTLDALALVGRLSFGPLESLTKANQMHFPDCFPGTLVALDPTYEPPIPGALRVVLLDGEQGLILITDLDAKSDPFDLPDEIHLSVGKPQIAG